MSETTPDAFDAPLAGDDFFKALVHTIAPSEGVTLTETPAEETPAAAAPGGQPAAPAEGTPPAGDPAAAPAAGDDGKPAVPAEEPKPADAAAPAEPVAPVDNAGGLREVAEVLPAIGELSVDLERAAVTVYQESTLTEMQAEFPKYFEALNTHARALVGVKVPALGNEPNQDADGMIVLADSADAKDWQEGAKAALQQEMRSRVNARMDESKAELQLLHSSIELFQNNHDLIPGTKTFDKELAERFTTLAKPYEVRNEENQKLVGYSIPVQPLIDQVRSQLVAGRTATAAPGGAPAQQAAPAATAAAPSPQAGIGSKPGASPDAQGDEIGALFGTLGIGNFHL